MFALQYHDATKHSFNRFARSSGRLDWATQPNPFRLYPGAAAISLPRAPLRTAPPFAALYDGSARPAVIDRAAIGEFLRCAMGLSAWKQYQSSRWALRVNPSSGNLHPTECYVAWQGRICHYAPHAHALEQRASIDAPQWAGHGPGDGVLVALTSIFWREAWKYGERAFRYCQHDVGHAVGALRYSAALLGWRLTLLPRWSDQQIAGFLGVDRDGDYADAEREEAECMAFVGPGDPVPFADTDPAPLVAAARAAAWSGHANRLSPSHVPWEIIDRVAAATRYAGSPPVGGEGIGDRGKQAREEGEVGGAPDARQVILQRRSAVAFDATSSLPRAAFFAMLRRLQPDRPPWDAITWPPHVHLALFVHRVEGLTPGIYACLRDATVLEEWKRAMRPEFLWEPVADDSNVRLFLLVPIDATWMATRVSCDQDIAGNGFFSCGMIARVASALEQRGDWFYRRLFWECGLLGQVLYLEAEAAAARATGIGCFYDDAVHDLLGLSGSEWQSLYHFSMGSPVDDGRLTTEGGYEEGF